MRDSSTPWLWTSSIPILWDPSVVSVFSVVAFPVVIRVMSSMCALSNGSVCPHQAESPLHGFLPLWSPCPCQHKQEWWYGTSHWDSNFQTLPVSHVLCCGEFHPKGTVDTWRDWWSLLGLRRSAGSPLSGHGAPCVHEMKPYYSKVCLVGFCFLDGAPYHGHVLWAPWESGIPVVWIAVSGWISPFVWINVVSLLTSQVLTWKFLWIRYSRRARWSNVLCFNRKQLWTPLSKFLFSKDQTKQSLIICSDVLRYKAQEEG